MINREFRKHVLMDLLAFCDENNLVMKTNDGITELQEYNAGSVYDKDTLFWFLRNEYTLGYIRFSEIDNENSYVLVDNKSISLMISNRMQRLTSYPSDSFNDSVDKILEVSKGMKDIFSFMTKYKYKM